MEKEVSERKFSTVFGQFSSLLLQSGRKSQLKRKMAWSEPLFAEYLFPQKNEVRTLEVLNKITWWKILTFK